MLRFLIRNVPKLAIACAAVLLTSAVAAQSSSPSTGSSTLDEARRLLRDGQTDSALAAIEQRLAVNSSDRHARFLKGVVLAEKADTEAAIAVFVALSRDFPRLPEPYNNLAVLYASKHDYERARDALLQAINTHPSYATAHENLGDIYAKMAGLAYTRALSLDTDNDAAKDKLALIGDLFAEPGVAVAAAKPVTKPLVVAAAPERVAAAAAVAPVEEPVRQAAPQVTPKATPVPQATVIETPSAKSSLAEVPLDGAIDAVQSWARAWASQDVEDYLDHYVARKSPDASMSRKRWEQRRRVRISKPRSVSIDVDDFLMQRKGPKQVVVTFAQAYRSDTYADRVRKSLTMTWIGDGWKISDERTVAKL